MSRLRIESGFDYVIVGGGTAGAVLADRLSADPAVRVLLLEAGGAGSSPLVSIPAGFVGMVNSPRFSWCYRTEPVPSLGDRTLPCPRGRVLGGSSSINGMIYVRGQPEDFDGWRALGNAGWGWSNLRGYFRRAFHQSRGADAHHGVGGPITVSDCPLPDPLSDRFLEAALHAGLPSNPDFNGAHQEGAGYYQFNIADGKRCGVRSAYLARARRRPNLRVETRAEVDEVLLEGRRAVGVRYRLGGRVRSVSAGREVILAAGAVGSPNLLLRSGVGPGQALQELGIPVVLDLPGVGENLQDHFLVRSSYAVRGLASLNRLRSPLHQAAAIYRWLVHRGGPLANGPTTVGAFFRTRPELDRPDAQLHFVPCSFDVVGGTQRLHAFEGMTSCIYQLRPESRGQVRLASRAPGAAPQIRPNHLDTELDRDAVVAALEFQRAIFRAAPLEPYRGRELEPGDGVLSRADWLRFARETGESGHHLAGSCKMGSDELAVVDAELRVRGLAGLRVVDASIMPTLVSGNTHAATVVIAEKAADLILSRPLLEAGEARPREDRRPPRAELDRRRAPARDEVTA